MRYQSTLLAPALRSLIENGKCDGEFCACVVSIPEGYVGELKCPDWLDASTSNSIGASVISSSLTCVPNGVNDTNISDIWGEGEVACSRNLESYFVSFANSSIECVTSDAGDNTTVIGRITKWTIRDGDGPLVINYTETNPAPECPLTMPVTMAPSLSPSMEVTDSGTSMRKIAFLSLVSVLGSMALMLW